MAVGTQGHDAVLVKDVSHARGDCGCEHCSLTQRSVDLRPLHGLPRESAQAAPVDSDEGTSVPDEERVRQDAEVAHAGEEVSVVQVAVAEGLQ